MQCEKRFAAQFLDSTNRTNPTGIDLLAEGSRQMRRFATSRARIFARAQIGTRPAVPNSPMGAVSQ
jgi:hypothetical protein